MTIVTLYYDHAVIGFDGIFRGSISTKSVMQDNDTATGSKSLSV
jgi:hypothetical protein